jgi:dihydropyrimidinase
MLDKNIIIDEGKIIGFTNDIPACDKKINGKGLISIPGPIDTHVHYGVYSPIDKAAKTESHAAAIGGITTMMRMLRLGNSFKSSLPDQLEAASKNHYIDYTIHASIFTPTQISEMPYCIEKGITSFKIYMNLGGDVGHVYMDMSPYSSQLSEKIVNVNDKLVEEIVKTAASLGCPVLVHAEDYESCACGIKTAKEKKRDDLLNLSQKQSRQFANLDETITAQFTLSILVLKEHYSKSQKSENLELEFLLRHVHIILHYHMKIRKDILPKSCLQLELHKTMLQYGMHYQTI